MVPGEGVWASLSWRVDNILVLRNVVCFWALALYFTCILNVFFYEANTSWLKFFFNNKSHRHLYKRTLWWAFFVGLATVFIIKYYFLDAFSVPFPLEHSFLFCPRLAYNFSQLLIHQPLWHMDLNALHHILCWTQVFQFRFFQFCFLIGSFSCNFYFHPLIWLFCHLPYVYLDQTRNSVLGEDGNPCWLLGPWLFLAMFFWLSNASWPKVCTCSSKFLSSNSLFDLL